MIRQSCNLSTKISRSTVSRIIQRFGIMTRVAKKSSIISKKHKKRRLEFCNNFKEWDSKCWADVLFSDETQIRLAPSYRVLVKRPKNTAFKKNML